MALRNSALKTTKESGFDMKISAEMLCFLYVQKKEAVKKGNKGQLLAYSV